VLLAQLPWRSLHRLIVETVTATRRTTVPRLSKRRRLLLGRRTNPRERSYASTHALSSEHLHGKHAPAGQPVHDSKTVPGKSHTTPPQPAESIPHSPGEPSQRPRAKSRGTDMSTASIKSGVIGLGPGQQQESDTADTDRLFPLTGGVIWNHGHGHMATTPHPVASDPSTLPQANVAERELHVQQGTVPHQSTSHHVDKCPQPARLESPHRHIPGEFISTPNEQGSTFLDYTTVIQSTSTSAAPLSTDAKAHHDPTSTQKLSTGVHTSIAPSKPTDHELRHTGTLDEPLSRSREHHHHNHGEESTLAGSTDPAVLPAESPYVSGPHGKPSEENVFYGIDGAPAPVVAHAAPSENAVRNRDTRSTSVSDAILEKDAEHRRERNVGVAATGVKDHGVHEVIQAYGDHRMTQPKAAMNAQRHDLNAPGACASNPVASNSEYDYNDPVIHHNVNDIDSETRTHIRKEAAPGDVAGAEIVGTGAYTGSTSTENTQQLPLHQSAPLRQDNENHPNHPRWKGRNLLHKTPPKGHPTRELSEHPPSPETGSVIEPHTGLPTNVGKYGPGTGGTDGNPAIHGQHGRDARSAAPTQVGAG